MGPEQSREQNHCREATRPNCPVPVPVPILLSLQATPAPPQAWVHETQLSFCLLGPSRLCVAPETPRVPCCSPRPGAPGSRGPSAAERVRVASGLPRAAGNEETTVNRLGARWRPLGASGSAHKAPNEVTSQRVFKGQSPWAWKRMSPAGLGCVSRPLGSNGAEREGDCEA